MIQFVVNYCLAMSWESVSDLQFKKELKHLSLDGHKLRHPPERLVQILKSPIFLQTMVHVPKRGFYLSRFIENQSTLGGDPANWIIESDLQKENWSLSDGKSKVEMSPTYGRVFLKQRSNNEWLHRDNASLFYTECSISIKESFDEESKSFTVVYYRRKSGIFSQAPIAHYEWTVRSIGNNMSDVDLRILLAQSNWSAKNGLIRVLETIASITDVERYQAQKLEDMRKSQEEKRLEQEKILEAQGVVSQRAQEETDRLKKDQCLSCGAACVQRRRKSDGHLFFGCSKYFTTSCKGAHSIPCPKCGLEMIERRRKEGGTFLGCTGWPGCNGSRTVDARLASERGVGTRKADTRKSYLSREEREEAKAYIDALDEANSHDEEEAWWEEWGDRVHSDDPRETPQYYDHRLLDTWREDPDVP